VVAAARRGRTDPTYPTTQEWIEAAAGVGLLYPPGTTWHYSNIGYMVAGLIAARAGGADLARLFRTQIIDPPPTTQATSCSTRCKTSTGRIGTLAPGRIGTLAPHRDDQPRLLRGGRASAFEAPFLEADVP
jgi:hypothetical protein